MKIKIGDFSNMNDVSIQTLRYYDKINLLKPSYIDPDTNYRYYDIGQCVLLDTILYLRSLNFSLQSIRSFLTQTGATVESIIEERSATLIKERERIDEQLFLMNQFKDSYQRFETNKTYFKFGIETLPKRYAYMENILGSIYEMDDGEYELCLRAFKKHISTSSLDLMYFNRVGTIIKQTDFETHHYFSNQMFVFVPKHLANVFIPRGEFAVMYVYEFEGEKQALNEFHNSIHANGYTVSGDYYCEVVMEKPYLNQEQRSMFIRMQVSVTKK